MLVEGPPEGLLDLANESISKAVAQSPYSEEDARESLNTILEEEVTENFPGLSYVGAGVESIVVKNSKDNEEVTSYIHSELSSSVFDEALQFRVNKVMSSLFPDNIPNISSIQRRDALGMKRQEIIKGVDAVTKNRFEPIYRLVRRHNIPININDAQSENAHNFIVDSQGNEYYVDPPIIGGDLDDWDFSSFDALIKDPVYISYAKEHLHSDIGNIKDAVRKEVVRIRELLISQELAQRLLDKDDGVSDYGDDISYMNSSCAKYDINKENVVRNIKALGKIENTSVRSLQDIKKKVEVFLQGI